MRILFLINLLLIAVRISGQNENFPPLDEQMTLISQPLLDAETVNIIRIHIGSEKFLTKFPNAPLWTSLGVQIPSRQNQTVMNYYCRYASEGIFRKVLPGIGYNYWFHPARSKRHRIDVGAGLEMAVHSIDFQRVNAEEGDPLLQEGLMATTTFRPALIMGYTHYPEYSGNSFKGDLVFRKGIGFNNNFIFLGRIQANIVAGKSLKLKPTLLQSLAGFRTPLFQLLIDVEVSDFFLFGVAYLSDRRYGFQFDLPVDMIYREDHTLHVCFRVIFQPKHLISFGGTSYGLSVNYWIDRD